MSKNEKGTFKEKLKLAGNWVANHKAEIAVASVVTGAIVYAAYKGQKQKTPLVTDGKILPIAYYLSKDDQDNGWALAMNKYDGDGNEVNLHEVVEQLINGVYDQVDSNVTIFGGGRRQ